MKGGLSVGSDAVLTERNISGNVSSLLGESVFIGEEALSPDLRSKLITTAGGSITGALTVADLRLPNNGNWYIGTASARCDLVLVNTNACLRSETGDLLLGASGNIRPLAFVDFSPSQGGRADIPKGKTEIVLFSSGISDNSVICVTPAQRIDTLYWVETDPLGRAKLCLGTALDHTVSFHYVLLRK